MRAFFRCGSFLICSLLLFCISLPFAASASLISATVTIERIFGGNAIYSETDVVTDGLGPEFADSFFANFDIEASSISLTFNQTIGYSVGTPRQHYLISDLSWVDDPLAVITGISVAFGGTITLFSGDPFSSADVEFFDNAIKIFVGGLQFAPDVFIEIDLQTSHLAPVPVPAALPLFGTGLGIMGFISWRRKRRMARQAAA